MSFDFEHFLLHVQNNHFQFCAKFHFDVKFLFFLTDPSLTVQQKNCIAMNCHQYWMLRYDQQIRNTMIQKF